MRISDVSSYCCSSDLLFAQGERCFKLRLLSCDAFTEHGLLALGLKVELIALSRQRRIVLLLLGLQVVVEVCLLLLLLELLCLYHGVGLHLGHFRIRLVLLRRKLRRVVQVTLWILHARSVEFPAAGLM